MPGSCPLKLPTLPPTSPAPSPASVRRRHRAALAVLTGAVWLTLVPVQVPAQARMPSAPASTPRIDPKILASRLTLRLRDVPLPLALDSLGRSTGLRLNLDNAVSREQRVSLFVSEATVGEVIDLLMATQVLAMRVIDDHTLVLFQDQPAKRAEYELLQLRVLPVRHGDATQLATLLKTMLKNNQLVTENRGNALVLRDTPERLDLAEQVLAANDLPVHDVMVDFEIVEVSRQRLSDLGMAWPTGITVAAVPANGGTTLGSLNGLTRDGWRFSPLSASLNLKLQDLEGSVLASPRLRVRDREKGRVLVGDKVPTITNSIVSTGAAAGGTGDAATGGTTGTNSGNNGGGATTFTGTVQYIDVGLKIEVEPRVHGQDEVSLVLDLEISRIAQTIATASGQAFQIGTRQARTTMRLRSGETQWLGGLISRQDRNAASGVPGLSELPVTARLFGHDSTDAGDTELLLAVTPRIVQATPDLPPGVRSVDSGTDARVRARPWGVSAAAEGDNRLGDVDGPAGRVGVPDPLGNAFTGRPTVAPRVIRGGRPNLLPPLPRPESDGADPAR